MFFLLQLFDTHSLLSFIRLLAVMPEGKSTLLLLHFHHSFSSWAFPDPGLVFHSQELAFFQLNPGHLPDGIASPQQRHVRPRPSGLNPGKVQKAKDPPFRSHRKSNREVSTLEKCKKQRIHHLDLIQLWLSTLDTEGLSGLPLTNKFA